MSSLTSDLLTIGQEIFTTGSTQVHNLGELAVTPDGRRFRYCKAGATTLVPGKIYQASAQDTSNLQNLSIAAAAVGATTVTTTTTVTLSANQVAGGYLVVTSSAGAGYTYRIKSHPTVSSAVVTFTLEDPIRVALTTGSKIDVTPNVYDSVVVNPTTFTSNVVGAAIYEVRNGEYGWLQTHGPIGLLADGAVNVGTEVIASAATAGAVSSVASAAPITGTAQVLGFAVTGIATTEYGTIFLQID